MGGRYILNVQPNNRYEIYDFDVGRTLACGITYIDARKIVQTLNDFDKICEYDMSYINAILDGTVEKEIDE